MLPETFPSFPIGLNQETAAAAGGVLGGWFLSDLFGETVKTASGQTGWAGFGVELITKGALGYGLLRAAKGVGAVGRLGLLGGALGVCSSIIMDFIQLISPGAPHTLGHKLGLALRGMGWRRSFSPSPSPSPSPGGGETQVSGMF